MEKRFGRERSAKGVKFIVDLAANDSINRAVASILSNRFKGKRGYAAFSRSLLLGSP